MEEIKTTEQLKNPNEERKIFGFNRNIMFTGIISFLTDFSVKIIYSIMPMFLLSLGASKTSLALIEGIAESTASVFKVISGFWSDKIGKNKPFMLIGYGLSAIVLPLYAFVISPLQVLFIRFSERVGKGIRTAPRDSLIAGSVTNGETGKSFGLQKAMDNSGAIVGPLVAFGLLSLFPGNYRIIMLFAGIPAIIAIFVIIFGLKEVRKNKKELFTRFHYKDFSPKFYLFLGVIFIFTLGNSTDALLMVKANELGIKVTYIPLVYLVTSVVSVIMAIPIGTLSDRIGKEKILVTGFIIYAVVYFGFGTTTGTGLIVALFALYGLYSAATDGIQKAFISDLVDKNKKGTAMGIYNALLGLTLLPASIIAGVLYDKVNSSAPFYFGAITAVLAAICMLLFILYHKKDVRTKA
jgi:MFS family permease